VTLAVGGGESVFVGVPLGVDVVVSVTDAVAVGVRVPVMV